MIGVLAVSSTVRAQDDPNAQYINLLSGTLASETREIEVPVEVGVLRLQFSIHFTGEIDLKIVTPLGRPLVLSEPNISVTETKDNRAIVMWDPKPGVWKMRISGTGSFTAAAMAQGELYICCMQFFGRGGIYTMDRFTPTRGARQQAQIYATGYNIQTIDFQLINEQGDVIAPVKFRQSDYSNPSGFSLLIETPDQSFRVLTRGRDTNGKAFQRVFHWLIRPLPLDPAGPQNENSPVVTYNNQSLQDLAKGASFGEQKIIRAQILKWSDDQFLSEKGNPIGIRLKYQLRFPVEGSYTPLPQLYPERIGYGFTGALVMRIHKISIDPQPAGGQDSGNLLFGGRGTFKAGVTYSLTVDLVPNYTVYHEAKRSFCFQTKPYVQSGMRERFNREIMSDDRLRFRLSITGTDLEGRSPTLTENAYSPSLWYQGYLREGVIDCQEAGNNRQD